jgi:hypothetical protein
LKRFLGFAGRGHPRAVSVTENQLSNLSTD